LDPVLTKIETSKVAPTKKVPELGDKYNDAPEAEAVCGQTKNKAKTKIIKKLKIEN
jgi:hypothetical protein